VIAIDTNVLVRFLHDDDPGQCRKARNLIKHAVARGESVYISDIVLCETLWVLARSYGLSRPLLAEVIRGILSASNVVFSSADLVRNALEAYEAGRGDFSDYLIRANAAAAGAAALHTFDRALLREKGFAAP